jgi:hypothetical protein
VELRPDARIAVASRIETSSPSGQSPPNRLEPQTVQNTLAAWPGLR